MGEVRTIFKLKTSQFDSKLQDASKSLASFTEWAQKMGNSLKTVKDDFSGLSQKNVEVARSFGQITSGATNLKDKLKDLVTSYNQVASAYNKLTSEQQKSDFGRAMSESLSELERRIKQTKTELYSAKESTGGFTDALDKLAGKFGLSLKQLTSWGTAIAGVTAALKVTKEAFLSSQQNIDAWGATVASGESLYKGFLNALNTGDISGYLSKMNDIQNAARDAYNALGELATYNAFNRKNLASAKSDYSNAVADYREGTGSKDAIQKASDNLIAQMKEAQRLQQDAYEKAITELALQRGISPSDLRSVMTGSYGNYRDIKALPLTGKSMAFTPGGMFGGSVGYEKMYAANEQERLAQALRNITVKELDALQALGEAADMTSVEINNQRKATQRALNGRVGGYGGGGGGGASVKPLNIKLPKTDFTTNLYAPNEIANNWRESLAGVVDDFYNNIKAKRAFMVNTFAELNGIDLLLDIDETSTNAELQEAIDEINLYMGEHPIKLNFATGELEEAGSLAEIGKQTKEAWKEAAQAVQSIGSAFSQIKSPAAKVAGIIAEAIANVALSFSKALSSESKSIWTWIAAAASGTATMFATISAIQSATAGSYAEGGIIPGNSYSGDNLTANVNAGELILNRSAQANIASQLQSAERQQGGGTPYVSGEQIYMGLTNYLRRSGRGELLTARV